jgi:hypothetical protein
MGRETLLGMEAPAVWTSLAAHEPDIAALSLFYFSPPPPLEQRVALGPAEEAVLAGARDRSGRYGLPFWDAVLLCGLEAGALGGGLLDAVAYTQPEPRSSIGVSRSQAAAGEIERLAAAASPGRPLAIRSRFRRTGGGAAHLPLLDARCPVSPENQEAVAEIGRRLLPGGGLLLDSGRSYHLVGRTPVSTARLLELLAESLLYCPILDRVYIAHHLRRRWCSLRLSRGGRAGTTPRVVALL